MGSHEIHHAVPIDVDLRARGRHDAVFGGFEEPVGEGDHGVAEIDYGVVGEGLHVLPLPCFSGVVRLDLKAAEPVEEDGDGAEVGVGGKADGVFVSDVRDLVG